VTSDSPYHHGDLPNVLRRVSAEVLAERGVAGFSVREVSRRTGVSHTAATHHYRDAAGLLTAVAVEGFQHLATTTEEAAAGVADPVDALAALGRAYIRTGSDYPGHCAVMFRLDLLDVQDEAFILWSGRAYDVLIQAVRRIAEARRPDLDVALAASLCWATVQGLVTLDGVILHKASQHGLPEMSSEDLAEQVTRLLAEGLATGA
jgi:AcrR family transcriptional regulator